MHQNSLLSSRVKKILFLDRDGVNDDDKISLNFFQK